MLPVNETMLHVTVTRVQLNGKDAFTHVDLDYKRDTPTKALPPWNVDGSSVGGVASKQDQIIPNMQRIG